MAFPLFSTINVCKENRKKDNELEKWAFKNYNSQQVTKCKYSSTTNVLIMYRYNNSSVAALFLPSRPLSKICVNFHHKHFCLQESKCPYTQRVRPVEIMEATPKRAEPFPNRCGIYLNIFSSLDNPPIQQCFTCQNKETLRMTATSFFISP